MHYEIYSAQINETCMATIAKTQACLGKSLTFTNAVCHVMVDRLNLKAAGTSGRPSEIRREMTTVASCLEKKKRKQEMRLKEGPKP